MNAQKTADIIYYNFTQSELDEFKQSKEAIDTLIRYVESYDMLSLKSVLDDISKRQDEMLQHFSWCTPSLHCILVK